MLCPSCGHANIDGIDFCDVCQESLTAPAPTRGIEKRILEGCVADLAPKKALSVASRELISAAVDVMRDARVGCLLVIDGGKLAGVLSERELLRQVSDPFKLTSTAGSLMRTGLYSLREDDSVADAFHSMAVTGHRHLPVQLKQGDYGIVSARDLLHYLCR